MSRWLFLVVLPALVVMALSAACGTGRDLPAPVAHDASGPCGDPWSSDGQKRFWAVALPIVTHARWQRFRSGGTVVNLVGGGDVHFHRWVWRTDPDVVHPAERLHALEALQDELVLRRLVHGRRASGTCAEPLVLLVARVEAWRLVGEVLGLAMTDPPGLRQLHLPVASAVPGHGRVLVATLNPLPDQAATADGATLPIELAIRRLSEDQAELRLRVDGIESIVATRLFPKGRSRRSPQDLAGPEAAVEENQAAAARLRKLAPAYRAVSLRLSEEGTEIRWGHVAAVFDLILGAGLRDVELPGCGARLSFAEVDDPAFVPVLPPDDPVLTPGLGVAALLALLLAFGVTFAPLHERGARV